MKPRAFLLSIGAAIAIAIAGLAPMSASAQTSETGAASPPPPDVSRIIIRRPTGNVVMPETLAAPVPLPAGGAGTAGGPGAEVAGAGDGVVGADEPIGLEGLDGIEGRIVRREAPGDLVGAPPAVIPNATSADVNAPGVRIRLPGN